mmetsp:Transcript_34633/g.44463  ORF Transcript_34633/g.44463 Transcript_34633/m.44463 type:complete len:90 (+) Transcript_34633:112-381(+)
MKEACGDLGWWDVIMKILIEVYSMSYQSVQTFRGMLQVYWKSRLWLAIMSVISFQSSIVNLIQLKDVGHQANGMFAITVILSAVPSSLG